MDMAEIVGNRRGGRPRGPGYVSAGAACALLMTACTDPGSGLSYQAAAIEASQRGDQATAISLAEKEVARFSAPEQCSRANTYNCGTLALAYGSLAEYQILAGDTVAGESSFSRAKEALDLTDRANRSSATGIVYRDVSEGYWKTGDRARAIAVFKEGRAAGADSWLSMASAAGAVDKEPPTALPPADRVPGKGQ